MKSPIFIFSDDLYIFRSVEGAQVYLEPLIDEVEAFDAQGRILSIAACLTHGKKILWLIPVTLETVAITETENFDLEKLRSKLTSYLQRLKPEASGNVPPWSDLQIAELIEHAVRRAGYSDR